MQKLTSKFAAGLRPAATVSHASCHTHLLKVSTVISYNFSKTDVTTKQNATCLYSKIDFKIRRRTSSGSL
jgi:hypothetical protein